MGIETNIYAGNEKYREVYKIGIEYEDKFSKKLKDFFKDTDIICEQTDEFNYKDFNLYLNGVLVYSVELLRKF